MAFDDYETQVEADHDTEVSAAIAEIVANLPKEAEPEFSAATGAPADVQGDPATDRAVAAQVPVTPAPEAASAAAPAPGAPSVPPAPVTPPAEVTPDPAPDRGMLRLLEREGQVRDRESALEQRERQFSARLSEMEARIAGQSDFVERLHRDPVEALKSLGADADGISKVLLARAMGDKAPPEIKAAAEKLEWQREIDALKRQVTQSEAQRYHEAERLRVQSEARAFASTVPKDAQGTSKYPALARVAATDASFVEQEIFNEIARDAQERAAKEPNGRPIAPEVAAERLNKRWEVFSRAFQPAPAAGAPSGTPPAPTSTQVTTTAPQIAPPSTQPAGLPGQNKPAAKPLPAPRRPYWEQEYDAEREAALAEAVQIARGVVPAGR